MTLRNFGWQSDDLEHTAEIDGGTIRWATVTDTYDDDRPYTAGDEQRQPIAGFVANGPSVRAPIGVLEQMLAALGERAKPVAWIEPLRLQYAASDGDVAATRALLAAGGKPNAVVRGRTALSAALQAEQIEAATRLLEGGSDPNVRLEGGRRRSTSPPGTPRPAPGRRCCGRSSRPAPTSRRARRTARRPCSPGCRGTSPRRGSRSSSPLARR